MKDQEQTGRQRAGVAAFIDNIEQIGLVTERRWLSSLTPLKRDKGPISSAQPLSPQADLGRISASLETPSST